MQMVDICLHRGKIYKVIQGQTLTFGRQMFFWIALLAQDKGQNTANYDTFCGTFGRIRLPRHERTKFYDY